MHGRSEKILQGGNEVPGHVRLKLDSTYGLYSREMFRPLKGCPGMCC